MIRITLVLNGQYMFMFRVGNTLDYIGLYVVLELKVGGSSSSTSIIQILHHGINWGLIRVIRENKMYF